MTAEKVDAFPNPPGRGGHLLKYPFKEIAEDGGVWRLDPHEYGAKEPRTVANAAAAWASRNGYQYRTQTHDGCVFIQLTTRNGSTS